MNLTSKDRVATFRGASANRKLAPLRYEPHKGRLRPVPRAPYCASTLVSVSATCDGRACRFKDHGCFAQTGFTGHAVRMLDENARTLAGIEVIEQEVAAIDASFSPRLGRRRRALGEAFPVPQDGGRDGRSGRDLRLHVAGDVPDEPSARLLAGAAARWRERGGGAVWTYTHAWRRIRREAWDSIAVFASVETPEAARQAMREGYNVALVVREMPGERAFRLGRSLKVLPCPAETRGRTCVECRYCLDPKVEGRAVAFAAHGVGVEAVKRTLPVLAS